MKSASAPVTVKSQAEICAVPRSVEKPATPKRAAVTDSGRAPEHMPPVARGARFRAAKASEAEMAEFVMRSPFAQLAVDCFGVSAGRAMLSSNMRHSAEIFEALVNA